VYSTMAALLKSGDHIVSSSSVLEQLIHVWIISQMEYRDFLFWHQQTRNDWKFNNAWHKDSFAESPTNPAVDIIDLELGILQKQQFDHVIDNLFCNLICSNL
jgi:O-succinylhomoserine sulfhydrylase